MKDDILKFENEKEIFYSKMLVEKERIELQNFELIRREDRLKMGIKDLKIAAGELFVLIFIKTQLYYFDFFTLLEFWCASF